MMRVISIAGTYQPVRCGVAHYTAQLRHTLEPLGVQSWVLTTHAAAEAVGQPDVIGVVPDWSVSALMPLVRSLQTLPADLLHIQHAAGTYRFERAIFLLPLLLKLAGWRKPIVTTVHEYGWWEWQPQWIPSSLLEWLKQWGQAHHWWDREDGFLLTHSDAIITTNDEAETVLRSRLPAFNDRIHRIAIAPNIEVVPIDRAAARRSLLQKCNWNEDAEIIVFFGFLHPVKGLETLLPAFQQVVASRPQARLLLLGLRCTHKSIADSFSENLILHNLDFSLPVLNKPRLLRFQPISKVEAEQGFQDLCSQISDLCVHGRLLGGVESLALAGEQATHYWNQLHTLVADLNLQQAVHFTGYVAAETASRYLSGASIGVLPFNHGVTLKSGSLLVLLAHGLPVIATRATPPDSNLAEQPWLHFTAPRDINQLTAQLIELLHRQTNVPSIGANGRQFVQQFAWDAIAAAHLQIYQNMLTNPLASDGVVKPI
ncbi:glycosyltransferase family 4 protein [Kovacikia minuta CCNUW1]|uniref:glycosyltransferase family 4 protein n=1 Tax=Kovacikia minuta TaxID=2931930 RepID=UPI001CCE8A8C|nr:glycosyltransferase family 4 protein [Kovacikia minuta]UBF26516.1 glycosyltransferase family 4 protein [Kovacikia minuta CCNUW1]